LVRRSPDLHSFSTDSANPATFHFMIDTHAHLHSRAFDPDRPEVLARVFDAGVRFVLEVNIDRPGWPATRDVLEMDRRVFGTVGIHPHDTGNATLTDLEALRAELEGPRIRAVGECGLDYYRDYAPYDVQREFFRRQVRWARETGKPLVVHSRQKKEGASSHDDVLAILEEEGKGEVRGVIHCFSGDLEIARRAHQLGFKLGMGGAISYGRKKNQQWVAKIAEAIGPESFLLETDCPYLTPHPHQAERNDPSFIPKIADYLADYLAMPVSEIDRLTDASAIALFRFEESAPPPPHE
jgi:TatD DNase family protein